MAINHDVVRPIVAVAVGLLLAIYVYRFVTDPEPALRRAQEESVVMASRDILKRYVAPSIEIVDPVSPDRKVGKVYIYPTGGGWEISGHYRRDENDSWHAYLMSLSEAGSLESLKVQDSNDALVRASATDPKLSVVSP